MYLVACEESSPPVFDTLDRSSSDVLYFLQLGQQHQIFVIIHILFIEPMLSFFLNIYSLRTRFRLRPKSKCNDGAWFSFTHCNWHSLILIHQVVFVLVTVKTDHKTVKQATWIDSTHWLICVQIQICLCRVVQMSYFSYLLCRISSYIIKGP